MLIYAQHCGGLVTHPRVIVFLYFLRAKKNTGFKHTIYAFCVIYGKSKEVAYPYMPRFAGASGAGKSTSAAVSQSVGGHAFEEDQVSLRSLADKCFTADAWGYNVRSCHVPLRAIFLLKQAVENRITDLKQSQVAHLLIQRHYETLGMSLSDDLIQKSFPIAANIARSVPGYELYFTKSPDFWELIDEKFPD
jgi:hypothetical protein